MVRAASTAVWGPTKWSGEFVIRSLALKTPFLSEPMHCSLFTQTHLLPSSSCAKLILSEALTLSWATMSGGAMEKGGSPPSIALFRVTTPLVKSPQPWKKRRGDGGVDVIKTEYACIKFNTFVPMATIQHVIHLSSRIRADGVLCLGPGEHGCLEQAWPPFPPPDQHPGHSPRCYFSLIHICFVFSLLITRQMTTMVKKRRG